jgi:hypothetical protein
VNRILQRPGGRRGRKSLSRRKAEWKELTRTKLRTFSGAIKRSGSKDPSKVSNLLRSEITRIYRTAEESGGGEREGSIPHQGDGLREDERSR